MGDRRLPGLLALAGAVVLGLGCWLPYNSQGGTEYEVFQRHGSNRQLWYAVEPAAVIIAAAALGLMLLRGRLPVVCPACWSRSAYRRRSCGWAPRIVAQANFGEGQSPHVKEGGWIGIAGSVVIAAAGVVALRTAPTDGTPPPAGWYANPTDDGLRYWSGSFWTEHTADRPTGP